ncbi:MAG: hypothetical protein J6V83_05260, partial [Clostridia bacterium]|nr:hypothetical protein [Clostridia bacterium]
MKHGLAHKLVLIFIVVALLCALFACSPREQDDVNDPHNDIVLGEDSNVTEEEVRLTEDAKTGDVQKLILESAENHKLFYQDKKTDDPEWFVIDVEFDYNFEHFWLDNKEKYNKSSSFSVIFKSNIHLKDSNKSELFFEIRNSSNYLVMA